MDVVIILIVVSLILVAVALAFFISRLRGGDFDHGDRLSLLPLDDSERHTDPAENADDEANATPDKEPGVPSQNRAVIDPDKKNVEAGKGDSFHGSR